MDGLDQLGAEVGFDWGGLLQTGGGALTAWAEKTEADKVAEKSKIIEQQSADAAAQADLAAASAIARADVSSQLKSKSAAQDMKAAQAAVAAQDKFDVSDDRVKVAEKQLADAQARAKTNPKDGYVMALVKAWSLVVDKLHGGSKDAAADSESWLTRRVLGPLPGYGVLVLGIGLVVLVGMIII
jgi:hypothetical protein